MLSGGCRDGVQARSAAGALLRLYRFNFACFDTREVLAPRTTPSFAYQLTRVSCRKRDGGKCLSSLVFRHRRTLLALSLCDG